MTLGRIRDFSAKIALFLGAAGLILSLAAMWILPAVFGRTVVLLATPNAPEIVESNRALWEKGEPVAPIYGTPIGEPMTILFAERERIIVPPEDPSLTLYTVDKSKGQNPLQAQTARFAAKYGLIGSGILLVLGVLHFLWKSSRASKLQSSKDRIAP
jgi:hypothetical protein